jgi:hypothetical protein
MLTLKKENPAQDKTFFGEILIKAGETLINKRLISELLVSSVIQRSDNSSVLLQVSGGCHAIR